MKAIMACVCLAFVALAGTSARAMTTEEWKAAWVAATNEAQQEALLGRAGEVVPAVPTNALANLAVRVKLTGRKWQEAYDLAMADKSNAGSAAYAAAKLGLPVGPILERWAGDAINVGAIKKMYGALTGDKAMLAQGWWELLAVEKKWSYAEQAVRNGKDAYDCLMVPTAVSGKADADVVSALFDRVDRSRLTNEQYASLLERLLRITDVSDVTAALVGKLKSNLGSVR